jgi:hypothetical protein
VDYLQLYICLYNHSLQWIISNCTYACTATHYSGLSPTVHVCTFTHFSGIHPTVHLFVQPLTTVDYLQLYICLYNHSLQWIISNCTYACTATHYSGLSPTVHVCTFTHFSGLSSTVHKVRITTYFGGLSPPVYKHLKIQSGSYIICANSLTNIFLVKG